jgi:hypothetical protein
MFGIVGDDIVGFFLIYKIISLTIYILIETLVKKFFLNK